MKKKLSILQSRAIRAMANGAQTTALKIGCRIDTMESLVKRGLVRKIVLTCYKRFWSYHMNYRFYPLKRAFHRYQEFALKY